MEDKSQEQIYDAKYPVKDFKKTIFVFTSEELRKLTSLDTIVQMGQIAQVMIGNIVQQQCLPRVAVKNSPDIGVLYNIPAGQFYVYTPKVWCMRCNVRRANFNYKGSFYCQDCLNQVQAEEKVKVPEVKKDKKKV
jgi:hypothetical protein